ncbi:uncharacterized protein DSM5745_06093 [Aspergillus mulundensis]|uniref:Rhomboid family membrane protein n=1 Tax=Aspergillus mulundensis TaxID=1810919 RepID=A0A3D8RZH9_9EURO|nr:Uncharacterized protein DSM5745_06093 [Aspergillus mulundensis]RDW79241.1 Uncharacterized protein DSM5745_06093 [Aspergillus mulundensis]
MPDQEPTPIHPPTQPAPPPQTQADMQSQPPQLAQLQQTLPPNREADFARFKNYAAYTFLIASPILIALPPRKLDHLTVALTTAFGFSANHIARERTGRSIVDRIESRIARPHSSLPTEQAREYQARVRAERERRMEEVGISREEMEALRARRDQDRGVIGRVWMGDAEKGWKEKRIAEEREALAAGKGYGDLIKEQIWEVWNQGEKEGGGEDGGKKE